MHPVKIIFKTANYFPPLMYYLGFLLLPLGILLFLTSDYLLLGVATAAISIPLISTHYGFEIDFDTRFYKEFLWILGIKIGEPKSFETVEYIFINKNKTKQTFSTRANATTIIKDEYEAFIKFSESEKIHLFSNENKKRLIEKIDRKFRGSEIKIFDYTG